MSENNTAESQCGSSNPPMTIAPPNYSCRDLQNIEKQIAPMSLLPECYPQTQITIAVI